MTKKLVFKNALFTGSVLFSLSLICLFYPDICSKSCLIDFTSHNSNISLLQLQLRPRFRPVWTLPVVLQLLLLQQEDEANTLLQLPSTPVSLLLLNFSVHCLHCHYTHGVTSVTLECRLLNAISSSQR